MRAAAALLVATCLPFAVAAQSAPSADALAQQLANPVAALISVPLQSNWDTGIGPDGDAERWTLNVQPVVPVSLNERWNLISRTIVPLISQSGLAGRGSQSGVGDVVQSAFLSPKAPSEGGWIWGAGPVLLLPTGSDAFTLDQWAAGPTAVALRQVGPWTYGALANHLFSLSNRGRAPDLSATLVNPFVTRNLGRGITVSLAPEATYDWNGGGLTLPVNVAVAKVTKVGDQLMSVGGGARAYLASPSGGPDWGLRLSLTLLFPR